MSETSPKKRKRKYTKKDKDRTIKYIRTNLKRIEIRFQYDEYEQVIRPAIDSSRKSTATFIKEAIYEKMERDGLRKKEEKDKL